jgi:hypothetical protein
MTDFIILLCGYLFLTERIRGFISFSERDEIGSFVFNILNKTGISVE